MSSKAEAPPVGAEPGVRYGPLVVSEVLTSGRKARVRFRCDCGAFHDALLHSVKTSAKKSGRLYGCKSCQAKAKSQIMVSAFDASRYMQKRFGRLLVTGVEADLGRRNGKVRLVCLCDCGAQALVVPVSLTAGKTTSCGCFHRERLSQVALETHLIHANTSSGELNGHTPLYRAWMKIKAGCIEGKKKGFGRVNHDFDLRWDEFLNFYADFGPIGRYETISRINNQLPWGKDNCFVNVGRRHLFEKEFCEVPA
jgi:hypothetical protein